MVTRTQLEEHWPTIKSRLRECWDILGDEELQEASHSVGRLIGLIEQRTGTPREEVETYLDQIVARAEGGMARATYTVSEHPMGAVITAFTCGFLTGLFLGGMMAVRRSAVPHSTAGVVGKRVLDALSEVLPDSIDQRLRRSASVRGRAF